MLTLAEVLQATRGRLHGDANNDAVRFTRVVVDSRAVTDGALFVALKGEKQDGHTFLAEALARRAAGALVERLPDVSGRFIEVPSTVDALSNMARFALDRHPTLEVIGITG